MNAGAAGSLLASLALGLARYPPDPRQGARRPRGVRRRRHALTGAEGRDLHALTLVADEMRGRQAGDVVTYVVNRNVNFTNGSSHCTFCAFSRDHPKRRATSCPSTGSCARREASDSGPLRSVHPGRPAAEARRALLHRSHPRDHDRPAGGSTSTRSHREVLYGSIVRACRSRILRSSGRRLGTLPAPRRSLDQAIRDVIARGRITVEQWVDVTTTAHALGSARPHDHVRSRRGRGSHWIHHMALLRAIQKDTGGFTEFVPLSLIHSEARCGRRGSSPGVRAGRHRARGREMHALAR